MTTERSTRHVLTPTLARTASKVPEVTVAFWITKALTTGMGESTSDFLVHRLPPVLAVALGFIAFLLALAIQFQSPRYIAWKYWLTVAMVGVFGTMAADVLHVGLGVPYLVSSVLFAASLTAIFTLWYLSERTLSIHSITTRRREVFYWAAVMATFALGTAAGDMSAVTLGLGYFSSGILFTIAILLPAIGYWKLPLNPILGFWSAYIITRPLGASFADWLGVSHARGGLDLGPGAVSLALALMIVISVVYLSRRPPRTARRHGGA